MEGKLKDNLHNYYYLKDLAYAVEQIIETTFKRECRVDIRTECRDTELSVQILNTSIFKYEKIITSYAQGSEHEINDAAKFLARDIGFEFVNLTIEKLVSEKKRNEMDKR